MEEIWKDRLVDFIKVVITFDDTQVVEAWESRRECPQTQSQKIHLQGRSQFSRLRWRCPHHHNVASLRSDTGLCFFHWMTLDDVNYSFACFHHEFTSTLVFLHFHEAEAATRLRVVVTSAVRRWDFHHRWLMTHFLPGTRRFSQCWILCFWRSLSGAPLTLHDICIAIECYRLTILALLYHNILPLWHLWRYMCQRLRIGFTWFCSFATCPILQNSTWNIRNNHVQRMIVAVVCQAVALFSALLWCWSSGQSARRS